MENLFKKVAAFTDIHFGLKNNSVVHNERCLAFVKWFIEEAKAEDVDCVIFCGDWHHNRSTLNIQTMDYSLEAMQLLNDSFEKVYMDVGNHDLYFRDNRQITSIEVSDLFPNITLVNEPLNVGNVGIYPWLVGDDHKLIPKDKSKYIFGHFELPTFYLNSMVVMPDHNGAKIESFANQDYVFSGHFHCRQQKNHIWYIGNAFPHNYSDAWDDKRGMMLMEWDGKPNFKSWPEQPVYRTLMLSEVLTNPPSYLTKHTYAKVTVDIELDFDEQQFIKEKLSEVLGLQELSFIQMKASIDDVNNGDQDTEFETVDEIFLKSLDNIESNTFETDLLKQIYLSL